MRLASLETAAELSLERDETKENISQMLEAFA